ncbi:ATP-binding protein [Streptomyces sp. NBC_00257]|uniref:ATP-binding protein n=1 Tax=unclassified Streptomyces TaxID=2593676 RepID=UPI00225602DD|nr:MULTISPECIES: ATP-binding protein [unclassified Streptomyces]MCX4398817.1 ATP-binding protein [Streptomyces sp. NBC_01767]MCX4870874.1 ATP-binding protein [Streptomyces sp. NBC_00906]MCX4901614.1 ATP-binding protein [Streptomyces sp. NBC_00892]MCX5426857.1 ATP-binding protein [Streptomyces sp. NBC_00062]WSP51110.1 ATP-binding protein [Streptomyces sp. NBC_01243]
MRTRNREPQTLGEGTLDRMARILAARNIDQASVAALPDEPQPFSRLDALSAGMPPRYQAAVADHPQVLAWAREVVEAAVAPSRGARRQVTTGPSLLMAGVVGAGKTHQAYGAVRQLVQSGVGVRWHATTAADLYADLRPRPGTDSERELAAISRCPLLIIDDLGAAKSSEWVEEVTYRLINRRYNHMLPTLITTNLAIKDLRAYLGDRVTSRLAQMTTRVEFEPVDRRRHRIAA